MRNISLQLLYILLVIISFSSTCFSKDGIDSPLKFISSCEIDLNNDNKKDIVILVDTFKGRELIALLRAGEGYNAFLLSDDKLNVNLSCHHGKYIKETAAGKGKKQERIYKTNGTYIKLSQPESSSAVYFWDNNCFKEIWTSD